jgi:integrase/recombinase XerD
VAFPMKQLAADAAYWQRLADVMGRVQVLANYKLRREDFLAGRPASYFFISRRGHQLDQSSVHRIFNRLSRQLGLRDPESSRGPRLHDFRHRFAVETLLRWYRTGEDVERRLPILSTYLSRSPEYFA